MSNTEQDLQRQVDELLKENKKLKEQLANETVRKEESYRQEDNLLQENKELRRKTFRTFNDEECWVFNEDGDNYLDSLMCPVVISADYLRDMFEALYTSSMWLDITVEEYGDLYDNVQEIDIKMAVESCKRLLKSFENEINGGCN